MLLTLGLVLVLALVVSVSVRSMEAEEADLPGTTYEINRGVSGDIYVSNYSAGEIWHIAASGTYTVYEEVWGVRDAKPDATGDIWFTNYAQTFGRVDISSQTVVTWTLPQAQNLGGLAIDDDGKVWFSQWFGLDLYRFDPVSTQICTYTLPLGAYSEYIVYDAGFLWLANWFQDLIYRLDAASNQYVYWEIEGTIVWPLGLGVNAEGDLWWADSGLDRLARLDPATDIMTTYDPPEGMDPQMLTVRPEGVWYTEHADGVGGTFGLLRPDEAASTSTGLVKTGPNGITPVCSNGGLGSGAESASVTHTGSLSWAIADYVPVVDENGWTVYSVPTGVSGDGPYGIADSGRFLWIGDQGREKLIRFATSVEHRIFLPVVLKQ
jgi:streptogramin lyase